MRILLPAVALLLLPWLAACNTVQGVGEDIEAAGDAVGDLARDTEEELEDQRQVRRRLTPDRLPSMADRSLSCLPGIWCDQREREWRMRPMQRDDC